jgi:hypothetical protein
VSGSTTCAAPTFDLEIPHLGEARIALTGNAGGLNTFCGACGTGSPSSPIRKEVMVLARRHGILRPLLTLLVLAIVAAALLGAALRVSHHGAHTEAGWTWDDARHAYVD